MLKVFKQFIGILLLPACAAAATILGQLLMMPRHVSIPVETWWFAGGFVFWLLLYVAFPPPVKSYIIAHELTHVIWGWFFGARARNFKVHQEGGSVELDRDHFLITLAPYFFPLYTLLVLAIFQLLQIFADPGDYRQFWFGLIGLTWSFHVTFTISMLFRKQTDILEQGRLFALPLIFFINVMGLAMWLTWTGPETWSGFLNKLTDELLHHYAVIADAGRQLIQKIRSPVQ